MKNFIFTLLAISLFGCGGSDSSTIYPRPSDITERSIYEGTWSGTWTDTNKIQTAATMTVYAGSFFATVIDYQNVNSANFSGHLSNKSIIISSSFFEPVSFQTYTGTGTVSVIDSHLIGTVDLNSFGTATFDYVKQ